MPIYLHEGLILREGDMIAVSEDCCCEEGECGCTGAFSGARFVIEGVVPKTTLGCQVCDEMNGTWDVPRANSTACNGLRSIVVLEDDCLGHEVRLLWHIGNGANPNTVWLRGFIDTLPTGIGEWGDRSPLYAEPHPCLDMAIDSSFWSGAGRCRLSLGGSVRVTLY